jgi:uncharacterized Zn-binding protein involved in type VI secretion
MAATPPLKQPAARVGDTTNHPGTITGDGVKSVRIGGMPAAVAGTSHSCAFPNPAAPHSPSVIEGGSKSVRIGGRPAARVGDKAGCGAMIMVGESTVKIGDKS